MNAERLHVIAKAVINEIDSTKSESTLKQIVNSLQNQVGQPQASQFQQQVSQNLEVLYSSLAAAPSNGFSPAWNQALKELNIRSLLGTDLSNQVRDIFQRNPITPSAALAQLQKIHVQLVGLKTALENLSNSFKLLNIGAEELKPGQCEVGILVPRSAIHNRLDEFSYDLSEIDGMLCVFSELTTGKRPGFQIRSISSSDLNVLMEMSPVVAAALAVAVERVLGIYRQVLEIRKLHGELKKQTVPDKALKPVVAHADAMMKDGIDKLVKELLTEYYHTNDTGRRNELATELSFALNKIANRIDKGYSVEVRVQPLSDGKQNLDKDKAASESVKHIDKIIALTRGLEFLKLEGDPILALPESKAAGKPKSKSKAKLSGKAKGKVKARATDKPAE